VRQFFPRGTGQRALAVHGGEEAFIVGQLWWLRRTDRKQQADIAAANILLTSAGEVKLADFGVSGQLTATMTKKVRPCSG
jgi:hypothetical protein